MAIVGFLLNRYIYAIVGLLIAIVVFLFIMVAYHDRRSRILDPVEANEERKRMRFYRNMLIVMAWIGGIVGYYTWKGRSKYQSRFRTALNVLDVLDTAAQE